MTPKELFKKVKEDEERVLRRLESASTSNSDFLDKLARGLEDVREETSFYWGKTWMFRKYYGPFEIHQKENCLTINFGKGRKLFCTFICDDVFDISCSNKLLLDNDGGLFDILGKSSTISIESPGAVSVALELILKVLVKFEEARK
jgi:hypothetical protein